MDWKQPLLALCDGKLHPFSLGDPPPRTIPPDGDLVSPPPLQHRGIYEGLPLVVVSRLFHVNLARGKIRMGERRSGKKHIMDRGQMKQRGGRQPRGGGGGPRGAMVSGQSVPQSDVVKGHRAGSDGETMWRDRIRMGAGLGGLP